MAEPVQRPFEPEYVRVEVISEIFDVSVSTLNKLRLTGGGPPFIKIGAAVRYHLPTAREHFAARMQRVLTPRCA